MSDEWRSVFLGQLERLVAQTPANLSPEPPDIVASEMLRMLMDDGATVVDETRSRFVGEQDTREPILSLIQLYAGAVQTICEQDLCREQEGMPSLFVSASLTSRWFLLEIVHSVRAVLLLSSRALDVQAVLALRQAWEFVARSIALAADPELGSRFDRLSTTAPSKRERSHLETEIRERLSPHRAFEQLARIETEACGGTEDFRREAWTRLREDYSALSNVAHGGAYLAGVSEWSNSWRYDTLSDGVSAPADGGSSWHFSDLLRRTFHMLTYVVSVYPVVAFRGERQGEIRTFFDDWVEHRPAVSEFENEYRLFLALHVLGQLGPEYDGLVFGLGDATESPE